MSDKDRILDKLDDIEKRLSEVETDIAVDREKGMSALGERLTMKNKLKKVYRHLKNIKERHDKEDIKNEEKDESKKTWKTFLIPLCVTIVGGIIVLSAPSIWTWIKKGLLLLLAT